MLLNKVFRKNEISQSVTNYDFKRMHIYMCVSSHTIYKVGVMH